MRDGGRGRRGGGDRWVAPVDAPGTLRLFFAVPVPADARARVGMLIDEVQASVGDGKARVRWVRVEGLHLTLRVLGQTAVERIPGLKAAADRLATATAPFEVTIARAGAFPNPARPRTLWLGIEAGAETLAQLADELGRAVEQDGGELGTRPFAPHLTIARTDGLRSGAVAARTLRDEAERLEARFVADRVILFRSHLGRGPASYEPIHEAVLTG